MREYKLQLIDIKLKAKSCKLQAIRGFTLIETMIATALFVVVMIIGIGVILSVNKSHKAADNLQRIMDSLSFTMEDMARNVRLGTDFNCLSSGTFNKAAVETQLSCPVSPTPASLKMESYFLAFEGLDGVADNTLSPANTSDQIVYLFTNAGNVNSNDGYLVKSNQGDPYALSTRITPSEVHLDMSKSGFTVTGAEKGDGRQPYIIIRLVGTAVYQNVTTPFDIQTGISPRNIDL